MNSDDDEVERRQCYVCMTGAMDQLVLTRAVYRRRYGTDLPEASVPSRFLEEIPAELMEELGTGRVGRTLLSDNSHGYSQNRRTRVSDPHEHARRAGAPAPHRSEPYYAYEDEDQSAQWVERPGRSANSTGPKYNSIDNIAEFFASGGKKFTITKLPVEEPEGRRGFRPGQKVRHPKYGQGTRYQRDGEGEEAKIKVQFPRFGF